MTGAAPGFVVATAAAVAFDRHERRAPDPLLPPGVFGSTALTAGLGVLVAASAALFGALFLGTYYLRDVLALDPLGSGLRALPLAAMMVLAAPVAPVPLRAWGPRRTTVTGMGLVALGTFLLSRLDQASTVPAIGGCFLLLGAGFSTVMVTATAVVVRHAPAGAPGVAGGLQQTALNVGPALGVAAATTLMALTAPHSPTGRPPGAAHRWTDAGFLAAMGPALTGLAVVAVAGALLATGLPGRPPRTHSPSETRPSTPPSVRPSETRPSARPSVRPSRGPKASRASASLARAWRK